MIVSTCFLVAAALASDIAAPTSEDPSPSSSWLADAWSLRHVDFGFDSVRYERPGLGISVVAPSVAFGVRFPVVELGGLGLLVQPSAFVAGGGSDEAFFAHVGAPVQLAVGYGLGYVPDTRYRLGVGVGAGATPHAVIGLGAANAIISPSLSARAGFSLREPILQDAGGVPPVQLVELVARAEMPGETGDARLATWFVGVHLQSYFPR